MYVCMSVYMAMALVISNGKSFILRMKNGLNQSHIMPYIHHRTEPAARSHSAQVVVGSHAPFCRSFWAICSYPLILLSKTSQPH